MAQTTDLAVSVEAQNISNNTVSQVHIFEEFQYVTTITNAGDTTTNVSFSQTLNSNVDVLAISSNNATGGSSLVTEIMFQNNTVTGNIANMPFGSSVQVVIRLRAPANLGGIATTATVTPNQETTDSNTSNNTSIISIDVVDVPIDFTITYQQVSPAEGTPISAWGDEVTYTMTITNNSTISYPLLGFKLFSQLNTPLSYGTPIIDVDSISCIDNTPGTDCFNVDVTATPDVIIDSTAAPELVFEFEGYRVFLPNGSLTFTIVYKYLEPCSLEQMPIDVSGHAELVINHDNQSSNQSETVQTDLLEAELCNYTDVCIETQQITPESTFVDWDEEITFKTTICNNGPLDADIIVSMRNYLGPEWEIISTNCIPEETSIDCNLINIANAGQYWVANSFVMPVGAIVTIETVVKYPEPECSVVSGDLVSFIRSSVIIDSESMYDNVLENNNYINTVTLPEIPLCEIIDLAVTKTQIDPMPPEGESENSTTQWGPITYNVTIENLNDEDLGFYMQDYFQFLDPEDTPIQGTLESVNCVGTTGTASCFEIPHTNIGTVHNGLPNGDNTNDVFWEVLPEDNLILPAQSSVSFNMVVNWMPECDNEAIKATNTVTISPTNAVDGNTNNNSVGVVTYFAPCIDLVVQTYPEENPVIINETFNWIVDITNSATSSKALNVEFVNTLNPVFEIDGTISCELTEGTASCISNFAVTDNIISGIIPEMEAGSTVQIKIPVKAPAYAGAFNNESEGVVNAINNEELTPETNTSITSVQVIAPTLTKVFEPSEIFINTTSSLQFTVNNFPSTPELSAISFTDNLPEGLVVASEPYWVNQNNCDANFQANVGGTAFSVDNLTFPEGVSSCTFAVDVTTPFVGEYINATANITDTNAIDASEVNATLTVIASTTPISTPNPPIMNNDCFTVPEGVSPNGDNFNETLVIPCIEDYHNTKLFIYNRYGTLVYENSNYDNTWAGEANQGVPKVSGKLPTGVYFYRVDFTTAGVPPKGGWLYLMY